MAKIANVALTNTFDTWRITTNKVFDRLSQFAINNSSLYANTVTANNNLNALKNATITKNLTVSGNTTTNKATVTSAFTVSGNTTLGASGKTITTTGVAAHTGTKTISTNLTVSGNTSTNKATVTSAFTVSGNTTFSNPITYGGVTLSNSVTGTGSMVLSTSPTLVTPALGVATSTSLALGGATIGTNALAVTGTATISGLTKIGTSAGSNQLEVGNNQNATTEISVRNTDTTNTTSRAFVRAYSGAVTGMMGAITGTAAYVGSDTNHPFNLTINGAAAATLSTDGAFTVGVNPKSLTGATALWAGVTNLSTLALGGATIGSNALAVTGTANISGTTTMAAFAATGTSSVIGITTIAGAASGNATATFRVFGGLSNSAGFQVTQNSTTDASLILNTVAGGTLGIGSNNAAVLTFAATTNAVAISTSLALGGATIGSNALAVTGTANISGNATFGGSVSIQSLGWFGIVSDGAFLFRNNATTAGGVINVATDSTFKFFARDGSTRAIMEGGTLALGGATIGSNALAVTGTATFSSTLGVTGATTLSSTLGVTGVTTHTGATTLSAALTYGGVTLSNSVTGTGSMVLSASPTLTGTVTTSTLTATSAVDIILSSASTGTVQSGIVRFVGRQASVDNEWNWVAAGSGLTGAEARLVNGVWTGTAQLRVSTTLITLPIAINYGGVTLSNSVTGTGSMVLSTSPTLTTLATVLSTNTGTNAGFNIYRSDSGYGLEMLAVGATGNSSINAKGGTFTLQANSTTALTLTGANAAVAGALIATKYASSTVTALTDGATITCDTSLNNHFSVTLAGNRTFALSAIPAIGTYIVYITQDATGSRTVTWPASNWSWAGGTAPTLTTTAAKVDVLMMVSNGSKVFASMSLNY